MAAVDRPTFTSSAVCAALDLPRGTLNSWAFKGAMRHFDSANTTAGLARQFTLRDVLALAIIKRLVRTPLRIRLAAASEWARVATDAVGAAADPGSVRELIWCEADGRQHLLTSGMEIPANPRRTIRIGLVEIFEPVRRRLDSSMPRVAGIPAA